MRALLAAGLLVVSGLAQAEAVLLSGIIGQRAILIVNGAAPKTVAVGESHQGVRLLAVQSDAAQVEVGGQRLSLRMGTPVSVGSQSAGASGGGGGSRIVLSADGSGHFISEGQINGRSVRFMLDTGATVVALSAADAQRIGLDYKNATPVRMSTANGVVAAHRLRLSSVRVGNVEVFDVDAIISPQPMPYVLLGNSFIGRFSMRRDADQMVLDKRF